MIKIYPYEIYLKDIECIKLIRKNTFNYDKGINLCDECINKYRLIIDEKNQDFVNYITNDFLHHKAYFYCFTRNFNWSIKNYISSTNSNFSIKIKYHIYKGIVGFITRSNSFSNSLANPLLIFFPAVFHTQ